MYLYLQSLVGLHGAIVFWTGMWTMLEGDYLLPSRLGLLRHVGYCVGGLALFVVFEVFHVVPNSVHLTDPKEFADALSRQTRKRGLVYSYLISLYMLSSSILFWVGLYNILDKLLPDTYLSQLLSVLVGFSLLVATHTLFFAAGVSGPMLHAVPAVSSSFHRPSSSPSSSSSPFSSPRVVTSTSSITVHSTSHTTTGTPVGLPHRVLVADSDSAGGDTHVLSTDCAEKWRNGLYVRRLFGLVGEIVIWVGCAKFLERHVFHRTMLRDLVYYLVGFGLMTLTSDFYCTRGSVHEDSSLLGDRDDEPRFGKALPPGQTKYDCVTRPELVYLRCVGAVLSFILFWTAMDDMLEHDSMLLRPSFWREALYIVLGLGLLVWTDSLAGQTTPFSWSRPTPVSLHPYDAIDSDGL